MTGFRFIWAFILVLLPACATIPLNGDGIVIVPSSPDYTRSASQTDLDLVLAEMVVNLDPGLKAQRDAFFIIGALAVGCAIGDCALQVNAGAQAPKGTTSQSRFSTDRIIPRSVLRADLELFDKQRDEIRDFVALSHGIAFMSERDAETLVVGNITTTDGSWANLNRDRLENLRTGTQSAKDRRDQLRLYLFAAREHPTGVESVSRLRVLETQFFQSVLTLEDNIATVKTALEQIEAHRTGAE